MSNATKWNEKRIMLKYIGPIIILLLTGQSLDAYYSPKADRDQVRVNRIRSAGDDQPNVELAVHNVGEVWMTISNVAQFGTGHLSQAIDPETGLEAPSCIFPGGSNIEHLYVGAFWIGAVVGRDTLVSVGIDDYYEVEEFWPDSRGIIEKKSIQPTSPYFSESAVSEQDFIATYTDTYVDPRFVEMDQNDNRPHEPLNIEIKQRSYAWSYDYTQDFILFDYSIKNIGRKDINHAYMSIYVDGDVHHTSVTGDEGYGDDLCGFRRDFPVEGSVCDFLDTINVAYITDNDGDPDDQGRFTPNSARSVAGVRVVRTPSDSLKYTFNWWATNYNPSEDFGPRRAPTADDPWRDMKGILGTPLGDANKYYVMRHEEFDYDQLFTAKDNTGAGWRARPANAEDIANGFDARYLLSFGPFFISPGEVLPVTFAWVLGEDLHVNPDDYSKYYGPYQPEIYYSKWDFSDLALNSRWASWVYDNPGYDTDSNGWAGPFRICNTDSVWAVDTITNDSIVSYWDYTLADTTYYLGDGVPDFRGARPPDPPVLRVIPRYSGLLEGELIIRWNGLPSETKKDIFSNLLDFEGYRVHLSLSRSKSGFYVLDSWDKKDFNRWAWSYAKRKWVLTDPPFTLDSLWALYGHGFNPEVNDLDSPLRIANATEPDSIYYFEAQDWNIGDLSDTLGIHKRFPDEPYPSTLNPDSAQLFYPEELTEDGYFKYFEYQYRIKDLLPSRLYYVSVTAYDYGSPGHNLKALESSQTINMVAAYPQNSVQMVEENNLNVVVYPNPYRLDGNYRANGFEGLGSDRPDDRVRAIHFTNLPHQCTIRIFSIDGDLVRTIYHNCDTEDPTCMHESWDLITRNTQAVVSGIYYYSVESEKGNQIGKIVIIL